MEYYYTRNILGFERALRYDLLKQENVDVDNIFGDEYDGLSGKTYALSFLKEKLVSGDVLYVSSLAVLGDSPKQVLDNFKYVVNKGVKVVALDSEYVDTRKYPVVEQIVIEAVGAIVEANDTFRRRRIAEGIKKAKENNVRFGRPETKITPKIKELARLKENKILTDGECAKLLGVSVHSFRHVYRKIKNTQNVL